MPERGYKTITVSTQLYQRVQQRAKKENKSAASFVSEALAIMLYVEDKFANYVPFLQLISIDNDEVIMRDNKKDRIFGVKAKAVPNMARAATSRMSKAFRRKSHLASEQV